MAWDRPLDAYDRFTESFSRPFGKWPKNILDNITSLKIPIGNAISEVRDTILNLFAYSPIEGITKSTILGIKKTLGLGARGIWSTPAIAASGI